MRYQVLTVSMRGCRGASVIFAESCDLAGLLSGHSRFQWSSLPHIKHPLLFLVRDFDLPWRLLDLPLYVFLLPLPGLWSDLPLSTIRPSPPDRVNLPLSSSSLSLDLAAPVTSFRLKVSLPYLRVSLS